MGLFLAGELSLLLREGDTTLLLRSGDTNQLDLFCFNFWLTPAYSSTYWSLGLKLLGGGHCHGASAWKVDVFSYWRRLIMCCNSPFEFFLFAIMCWYGAVLPVMSRSRFAKALVDCLLFLIAATFLNSDFFG